MHCYLVLCIVHLLWREHYCHVHLYTLSRLLRHQDSWQVAKRLDRAGPNSPIAPCSSMGFPKQQRWRQECQQPWEHRQLQGASGDVPVVCCDAVVPAVGDVLTVVDVHVLTSVPDVTATNTADYALLLLVCLVSLQPLTAVDAPSAISVINSSGVLT